ncbi:MAG: hypothetical protein ACOCRO_05415 [Halanaerobiales bacterium]
MPVDKYGFDTDSKGYSGINDWRELPEPYSEKEFIFQEIESDNESRTRLFKLVKAPDSHINLLNRIYSEMPMYNFAQNIEETTTYELEFVYLSGRYDDSYPDDIVLGGDYDIVKHKLNDFKKIDRF